MSRALLLKRHLVDAESRHLAELQIKPEPADAYYPLKSPADLYRQHPSLVHPMYTQPLDLSVKSSAGTPITPPSTPSPCLSVRRCKDEPQVSPKPQQQPQPPPRKKPKKQKANRKLSFDEDKSSPVSGTIIRDRSELSAHVVRKGDIDPMYNVVEVTEEAKAELAKIENKIGDYVCRLCNEVYQDAFSLAQHRCSCIIHVEYKCPECEKVFNCPANLASHRRWHKPKLAAKTDLIVDLQVKNVYRGGAEPMDFEQDSCSSDADADAQIPCPICRKLFRKQSYLRKHLGTHHISEIQHGIRPAYGFHHIAAN